MPKSKDVLNWQAEALEEFARLYDVAEKEADAYEQYPPDAVDYARRRAAELRAQAAALPDALPDQGAVIAENEACAKVAETFVHNSHAGIIAEAIRARHK